MLVLILLVIILLIIIYTTTKKDLNKQNKSSTYEINESTFNPYYKISKDENGVEVVDCKSCRI